MNAMISDLVARFSGDSLNRLNAAQVAQKVPTLKTERLLALRAAELQRSAVLRAEEEEARREDLAEAERQALEKADRGERADVNLTEVWEKGARITAWVSRVKALHSEYGLPASAQGMFGPAECSAGNVLESIQYRLQAIDRELEQRYRRDGEPEGAVALRSEIKKAKAATWPLTEAYRKAKERQNAEHSEASEANALQAAADLDRAQNHVASLRQRLRDEYALEG